jgi:hypothetical protein
MELTGYAERFSKNLKGRSSGNGVLPAPTLRGLTCRHPDRGLRLVGVHWLVVMSFLLPMDTFAHGRRDRNDLVYRI